LIGQFSFDVFGKLNPRPLTVQQVDNNSTWQLLSPIVVATANLVYPLPAWDERDFVYKYLGQTSEQVIIIITIIMIVLTFAILAFVIYLDASKSYIIGAATPIFLYIMLFGSLCFFASIFFWTLETASEVECILRVLLLSLGFTCLYGSLFIKTWRIALIYNKKSNMKMFSITLPKILIILSIIILVDLVLVIIMYVVDPYKPITFEPDPDRQAMNYDECTFATQDNSGFIVIILLLIKLILLVSGIVCTFLTRNVKYIHLNESKWIAYSIYNLFFSAVIVIIFEGIVTLFIARDILFVVRSVFIIYPTVVTNMCIFLPKFYFYFRGKDTRQRKKTFKKSE